MLKHETMEDRVHRVDWNWPEGTPSAEEVEEGSECAMARERFHSFLHAYDISQTGNSHFCRPVPS